ncbi:MAG: hypothetical protein WEB57_13495 [Pseudohongiellaceae bacterium]
MSDRQQFDASAGVPLRVWVSLGVLFLLALGVIFVLPGVVERYELPLTQRSAPASPQVSQETVDETPMLNTISPFEEAQRARQRRAAQDVLASLLERQEALEEAGVEQWAADRHEQALAAAREGDEQYRSRAFEAAFESYTQADETLAALQSEMPSVLDRLLAEGQAALADSEPAVAEERFSLALLIEPGNEDAELGLERSATLEEVEQLVESARRLQEDGDLEPAEERLEQAVALDGRYQPARDLLAMNREQQLDNEFTRIMSRGFALLSNGEPEAAIQAFEEARDVRPDAEKPDDAIRQAREQMINASIAGHRSQARGHENAEEWEQAVAAYEAALELDNNLVFAREGLDYAQRRMRLDRLIEQALADPARLGEQEILEYTTEVYETAASLDEQGPRLERQLAELDDLLTEARQPVEVRIRSDNETLVTVYRIGELGTFDSMALELRPGRYVAVGTRPGYRDVRREFVVGFGNEPGPITIECSEQVLTTGRR